MMKIEIWSDYVCPFCQIGKANLLQALEEMNVEAELIWRSFELDPSYPKDGPNRHYDVLEQKFQISQDAAKEKCAQLASVGDSCGLKMDFDRAYYGNTFLAHQLQQHANGFNQDTANAINQALFEAVFEHGLNISNVDVLVDLAHEHGLDEKAVRAVLENQTLAINVRADETAAAELNVSGVPFFGFDGRLAVAGAQSIDAFKEVIRHILENDVSADSQILRQ